MSTRITSPNLAEGRSKELLNGVKSKMGIVPIMMKTMTHSPAPPEMTVHRDLLWQEIHTDGFGVTEAKTTSDSLDALAAELSDAAYQVALRHGVADSWIDLELGLWRVFATKIKNWSRKSACSQYPRLALTLPKTGRLW